MARFCMLPGGWIRTVIVVTVRMIPWIAGLALVTYIVHKVAQ